MTIKATKYIKRIVPFLVIGILFDIGIAIFSSTPTSIFFYLYNVAAITVSGAFTSYLYETRRLPRGVLSAVDKFGRTTFKDFLRGFGLFVLEYQIAILGLLIVALWGRTVPALDTLPTSVQSVYNIAMQVGTVALMASMVWQIVSSLFNASVSTVELALACFERAILLIVGLIAIKAFAPELADMLAWVKANPDLSLSGIAGIIVVRVVFAFVPSRTVVAARGEYAYGVAVKPGQMVKAIPRRPRHPEDIQRTAAHEAGHVMLYAFLPTLPATLTVNVLSEIGPQDVYRGHVRFEAHDWPEFFTEKHLHWLMLMFLAGAEAEFATFADRTEGSSGDNEQWLNYATQYLVSGLGEVFYADPQADAQIAHNRVVLNSLKAHQVGELEVFFATNKTLLDELTHAIAEAKTMSRDDLAPYLNRVVFDAGTLKQ